jgi:periplasmic protein TonB
LNGLFEYIEENPRRGDVSLAVLLSIALHIAALVWIATRQATTPSTELADPVRYVQIVPELSRQFTEAPGPETDREPRIDAPLSDKNRKAMTPSPTGPEPTLRPGDGQGVFDGGPRGMPPAPPPAAAVPPASPPQAQPDVARPETSEQSERRAVEQRAQAMQAYREGSATATDAPPVDWQQALRNMQQGADQRPNAPRIGAYDAGGNIGGDLGTAETGPLSFESNWFEWGDYAAKMIARIRVHWYASMPELIRMGVRGMVTIRFTIERDGTISSIELLESSGVPPYDNAARRALELSSPLPPLPANFPRDRERVTIRYLYNMKLPGR